MGKSGTEIPMQSTLTLLSDAKARLREDMRLWAVELANNRDNKQVAQMIIKANYVLADIEALEKTIQGDTDTDASEEVVLDVSKGV